MKLINALYLMINKRNSAKLFWKIKNIYLDPNLKNFTILYVLSNSNSKCWTSFFGFYISCSWYQIVKLFVSAGLNVSRTNKYHILFIHIQNPMFMLSKEEFNCFYSMHESGDLYFDGGKDSKFDGGKMICKRS